MNLKPKIGIEFNYKARLNKSGEGLITIRVNHNGKLKRYNTNIWVKPQFWDKAQKKVKEIKSLPTQYARYNDFILKEYQTIKNAVDKIAENNDVFSFEALDGYLTKPNTQSLFAFIDTRLCTNKSLSNGTIQTYKACRKHLKSFREDIKLKDITPKFCQDFLNFLLKKLGKNSASKYMRILRTFINRAIDEDLLELNDYAFKKFKIPAQKYDRNEKFLTDEEIRAVKNCKLDENEEKIREMFMFAFYSGLRFGDVAHLTNKAIRGEGEKTEIVLTMKKTGEPLRIPIGNLWKSEGLLLLKKYSTLTNKEIIFNYSNQYANRILKKIAEKCGIQKNISFHTARHTFAMCLLNRGLPIETLQELLGHKSIKTTQIYARYLTKGINQQLKKIDMNI